MLTLEDFQASQFLQYSDSHLELIGWIIFASIAGIGGGIYFFVKGLRQHRFLRLIENIPTSPVRSVAAGLVEVKGQAIPCGEVLRAPFSGEACVYYQFEVKERRGYGRRKHWVTVAKEQSHDRFLLHDETGEILVSPIGADTDLNERVYSDSRGMPLAVEARLEGIGLVGSHMMRNRTKIREASIRPGQEIYIMGTAALLSHNKFSSGSSQSIIIRKGENEPFFLISDKSEKELHAAMRFWSKGGVFGGAAMALAGIGILMHFWVNEPGLLKAALSKLFS